MKPLLPKKSQSEGVPLESISEGSTFAIFSSKPHSSCWQCSDSPCIKLSKLVSPETMLIKGSNLPDFNVCPSRSISKNDFGKIVIDKDSCSGCGLCVVACPVNALVLSADSLPITEYSKLSNVGDQFHVTRAEIANSIQKIQQRITPSLVETALKSTSKLLKVDLDGKGTKIFVRNAFANSGLKTRIRIEGDTNDAFELVAESDEAVFPIEIAIGGDTLDSTRRILSGCASLISKGTVEVFSLKPILVVDEPTKFTFRYLPSD